MRLWETPWDKNTVTLREGKSVLFYCYFKSLTHVFVALKLRR